MKLTSKISLTLGLLGIIIFSSFSGTIVNAANQYTSYFSSSRQKVLNTWIQNKIVSRKSTLSPAEYKTFISGLSTKLNNLLANTNLSSNHRNTYGYILSEVDIIKKAVSTLVSLTVPTCSDDPVAYYYYYNPDVKASNIEAIIHWSTFGKIEGRKSCWNDKQEISVVSRGSENGGESSDLLPDPRLHNTPAIIPLEDTLMEVYPQTCTRDNYGTILQSPEGKRTDYIPLVSNSSRIDGLRYKDVYEPGNERMNYSTQKLSDFKLVSEGTGRGEKKTYSITHSNGNPKGVGIPQKYKVFIPPGTINLSMTFNYGTSNSCYYTRIAGAFGRVPKGTFNNFTDAYPYNINGARPSHLMLFSESIPDFLKYQKQEWLFVGPADTSTTFVPMMFGGFDIDCLSFNKNYNACLVQKGQWIYINAIAVPGNQVIKESMSTIIDKDCYDRWYKKAVANNWFGVDGNPIEVDPKTGETFWHTCN